MSDKMPDHRNVKDPWLTCTFFEKHAGISKKSLIDRGVISFEADGKTYYNLKDGVAKLGDLWAKKAQSDPKLESKTVDMQRDKEFEDVRKLRLDMDRREGMAISVVDVQKAIGQAARSIMDVLDAIPTRVKIGTPAIGQADLAAIQQTIILKRNELADHKRESET